MTVEGSDPAGKGGAASVLSGRNQAPAPARIQPFGWLAAFDQSWTITHLSANVAPPPGGDPHAFLGRPAAALFAGNALHELRSQAQFLLAMSAAPDAPLRLFGLDLLGDGRGHDVALHRVDPCWLIECEPARPRVGPDPAGVVGQMVRQFATCETLEALGKVAARMLRAFTGFADVVICRLEAVPAPPTVLGRSLAPSQTEQPLLFADAPSGGAHERRAEGDWAGGLRLVADARTGEPELAELLSARGAPHPAPCGLLAPADAAMLAAMDEAGYRAAFRLPIRVGGMPWGYALGHHREPHLLPFALRGACELFADRFGLAVESIEARSQAGNRAGNPVASGPAGGCALVVEDSLLIAMQAEELLRELGFSACETATSVAAALHCLEATRFDFALLDINLAGETSDEIAHRLTEAGIPFAFASGFGEFADVAARFAGVPVIGKPYVLGDLAEAYAATRR